MGRIVKEFPTTITYANAPHYATQAPMKNKNLPIDLHCICSLQPHCLFTISLRLSLRGTSNLIIVIVQGHDSYLPPPTATTPNMN